MHVVTTKAAWTVVSCLWAAFALFSARKLGGQEPLKPGRNKLTVWTEARNRQAYVQIPSSYTSEKPIPLVVVLHGAGSNGETTLDKNGWAEKAEKENFVAVAPDGVPARPGWPASFALNPRLWNDGQLRPESPRSKIDDVNFIRILLDELSKRLRIDADRIYVAGHSNGAGMTFRLGAELSERLVAIAAVAGHCWIPNPKPVHPLPTLYIIGTKDPLIPIAGGAVKTPWHERTNPPVEKTLTVWASALGIKNPPATVQDKDGVKIVRYGRETDAAFLTAIHIEGQGHGWPGGEDSKLPVSWIGPSVNRINATDMIWDFFKKFHKPSTAN